MGGMEGACISQGGERVRVRLLGALVSWIVGVGGTLGSGLPQPHFSTCPHVSPQHPHLLLAARRAQEWRVHTLQEVVLVPLELHLALGPASPGACG